MKYCLRLGSLPRKAAGFSIKSVFFPRFLSFLYNAEPLKSLTYTEKNGLFKIVTLHLLQTTTHLDRNFLPFSFATLHVCSYRARAGLRVARRSVSFAGKPTTSTPSAFVLVCIKNDIPPPPPHICLCEISNSAHQSI